MSNNKTKSILEILFPNYFNKGAVWERHISRKLRFMGEKYILKGVYLPTNRGEWTEIDLVVITAKGIFALECKNYGGTVKGQEKDKNWVQSFPNGENHSFYSPIMQNWGHIAALKSFLKNRDPKRYQSLILFADRCQVQVPKPVEANLWMCQERELRSTRKKWRKALPDILSKEQQEEMYQLLKPCTKVSQKVKREHRKTVANK